MSPGRGLRTGSRTRWAFRRIYDAGAGILSFLAAKTRPPARIRRRSRDSRRDYVREGSSGEKTAPGPGVSTESRTRSALRRENGTGTWGFDGIPYEKRPPAPHQKKRTPPKRGPHRCCVPRAYWMRVRQYGHTFQSALSGRWHVGQTFLTWVLQMGHTTKSRSIGAPHLGQIP